MNCRVTKRSLESYKIHATSGRVVVFDTETTGMGSEDEIIQIAAAEYLRGELTRTFCVYVVPTCPIDPGAEAVHHISMPYLVEHGIRPNEALDQFFEFVGRDALLVAHNIRFDFRMLQNECRKFDYEVDMESISYCDTIALAKRLVPGLAHYRLCCLIEELGLAAENSHDALDDTLACGALFFNLIGRLPSAGAERAQVV